LWIVIDGRKDVGFFKKKFKYVFSHFVHQKMRFADLVALIKQRQGVLFLI